MLYPEKISVKKGKLIVRIMLFGSFIIAIILVIINRLTTPNVPWSMLANGGIIYSLITVLYSINKNRNIAKYVLLQAFIISLLTLFIDYNLGFQGWSVRISTPIIIIIANITMFLLTIISYGKFIKYALYQLVIVILSLIPIFFILINMLERSNLTIIATVISILNFLFSFLLCSKDFKEIIVRKFHI